MKTLLGAAMRKAAELTRRQNVVEATQTIARALSAEDLGNQQKGSREDNAWLGAAAKAFSGSGKRSRRVDSASLVPPPSTVAILDPAAFMRDSIAAVWYPAPQPDPALLDAPSSPPDQPRKAPAAPVGDAFLTRAFAADAGERDYKLYVPSNVDGKLPLLVMLHGCTQDPDDFARGTGMNALAQDRGFIVAYPKQSKRANQTGCWNWFNAGDQIRDSGEPSIIAGMTRAIIEEFDIDPRRVYVAGLSAGGAMAAIMSATYPELYGGVGIHSGLPYGSASDASSAFAAMRGLAGKATHRAGKGRVRTIVFHGESDSTVHPSNAETIIATARAGLEGTTEQTHKGLSEGGRPYARTVIADASGAPHVEYWAIEGLGHAWSGGRPEGSYTDPKGPDASREMLRFFLDGPDKHKSKT
ncbi:extracellular catalytic domain type 1 short-chain-length polyhydroxyalkanoate depolymerase [Methylocapsa acidiphila]|uniref:extracellular catalytic domain type 1 short-chain-length polyhydroxyalkanoate depolymerase n=1 Tax=Methylocapsa acidiphila TaxID=133552 RepID=UPI00047A8F3E|nr:PHB depolymerase family esterase [Methylocapsa acidiphila]